MLQQREERLQALVEHLAGEVLLLSGKQRIVLVNPAAREFLTTLNHTTVGDRLIRLEQQPIETVFAHDPDGRGLRSRRPDLRHPG